MYLEMWIGLDCGIGVYNVLTSPLKSALHISPNSSDVIIFIRVLFLVYPSSFQEISIRLSVFESMERSLVSVLRVTEWA